MSRPMTVTLTDPSLSPQGSSSAQGNTGLLAHGSAWPGVWQVSGSSHLGRGALDYLPGPAWAAQRLPASTGSCAWLSCRSGPSLASSLSDLQGAPPPESSVELKTGPALHPAEVTPPLLPALRSRPKIPPGLLSPFSALPPLPLAEVPPPLKFQLSSPYPAQRVQLLPPAWFQPLLPSFSLPLLSGPS